MSSLLTVLVFICIISIIIGLVKPQVVVRWGKQEKRGRGRVILYYGLALFVLIIALGATSEGADAPKVVVSQDNQGSGIEVANKVEVEVTTLNVEASTKENTVGVESAAKKTKAEEKQDKEEAMAKENVERMKNPEWNIDEPDAMENGNIYMAIDMLTAIGESSPGQFENPADVIKTPWDFYGMAIVFSGVVAVVADYPPGSDQGKAGVASDIVIESDDGTIIEFFSMVPSGTVKAGDVVNITGYPIGRTEVANTLGGSFTHLMAVTNSLENNGY